MSAPTLDTSMVCIRCQTGPPHTSWRWNRERWEHACAALPPQTGHLPYGPPMHLYCAACGKSVSNEVPFNTIVRAVLACPECIEAGRVTFPEPHA